MKKKELVSLSYAVVAPSDIARDIMRVHEVGELAYQKFKSEHLECELPQMKFHNPMKKSNLRTFSHITKKKTVSKEGTVVMLKADKKNFANMILMAESRDLSMK